MARETMAQAIARLEKNQQDAIDRSNEYIAQAIDSFEAIHKEALSKMEAMVQQSAEQTEVEAQKPKPSWQWIEDKDGERYALLNEPGSSLIMATLESMQAVVGELAKLSK